MKKLPPLVYMQVDFKGWTPLIFACNEGHLEVAEELLQYGASVAKMSHVDDRLDDLGMVYNHHSSSGMVQPCMRALLSCLLLQLCIMHETT